ncbi:DUF2793 domain-containing protein [Palleronia caenipelagi]|uniref:DUF2793 domain-containing protein n=1 Tax=Palleronia caenipelagi TaxID=2489174 RepID=A0A547Q2W3_9RHOB|nr:DUF2793 domain-containing protein [Palleronia caenipelagi]TRD20709.1 DUF2793 domain-containing protein [Palleronia caenipelagi]
MSDLSPILQLPLLMPSQAQKHVTHNEALVRLDVLVQLVVEGFDAPAPPSIPAEGEVHVVGAGAGGDWTGQDGAVAAFTGGGWLFLPPCDGWLAIERGTGALRVFQGGAWAAPALGNLPMLGINASADTSNRLTVAADATLLTHSGSDHRLKVNKAGTSNTAVLLFQSDWSGRAEMGLAGEDAWSIKVSADGSVWQTALRVDPASAHITGEAVQAAPDDITPGRLMRADFGYGPGNLIGSVSQSGGLPTGAVIEAGAGYVRWADGTQICTGSFAETGLSLSTASAGGFAGTGIQVDFGTAFTVPPVVSLDLPGSAPALAKGADVTASGMAPVLWSAQSGTVDLSGRYLAVGRWF